MALGRAITDEACKISKRLCIVVEAFTKKEYARIWQDVRSADGGISEVQASLQSWIYHEEWHFAAFYTVWGEDPD
jgi:hypothetical protein